MNFKKKNKRGFTVVECVVAMAVILVVSASALVIFQMASRATQRRWDNYQIKLEANEYNGSTITEVGLWFRKYNSGFGYTNRLATHALIQDAEGHPISILKTDTDVIFINATFYCTFSATGWGDNGIYPDADQNGLVRWMLGTGSYNLRDMYVRAHHQQLAKSSDMVSDFLYSKSFDLAGTGTLATLQYVLKDITILDSEFNTSTVKTFGITGLGAFTFPDSSVFPDYDINRLVLGEGDGTTTVFNIRCPHIKADSLHVYVDSVEMTAGTDYTADLDSNCGDTRENYHTASMTVGESLVFGDMASRTASANYSDPCYWGVYPKSGTVYPTYCQVTAAKPIWVDFGAGKECNRLKIDSSSLSAAILNGVTIEYSDDNEHWTAVTATGTSAQISGSYYAYQWSWDSVTARYWRVYSAGQTWNYSLYRGGSYYGGLGGTTRDGVSVSGATFFLGRTVPGLIFSTAPADGQSVEASFKINAPYKTSNNLMRLSCTVQLQRE